MKKEKIDFGGMQLFTVPLPPLVHLCLAKLIAN